MRFTTTFSLSALLALGFALPAPGQAPTETEALKAQVEALKSDVQELKKTQGAILQQLNAIRDYLVRQNKPQNPVISVKGMPMRGSAATKLAVVEFTDYWCGFCARFARNTLPEVVRKYVDTGKIRYYVKDFPAQRGPKVAEAAHCAAEQNKYWSMHDILFANYGKYNAPDLARYAKEVGADPEAIRKCVESGKYEKEVQSGMEAGSAAGVDGTPTFLIGIVDSEDATKVKAVKTIVGAQSLEAIQAAIDGVIEEAR